MDIVVGTVSRFEARKENLSIENEVYRKGALLYNTEICRWRRCGKNGGSDIQKKGKGMAENTPKQKIRDSVFTNLFPSQLPGLAYYIVMVRILAPLLEQFCDGNLRNVLPYESRLVIWIVKSS